MGPGPELSDLLLGKRSARPMGHPRLPSFLMSRQSGGPTSPRLALPSSGAPGVRTFSHAARPVPIDLPLSRRSELSFRTYCPGPMPPNPASLPKRFARPKPFFTLCVGSVPALIPWVSRRLMVGPGEPFGSTPRERLRSGRSDVPILGALLWSVAGSGRVYTWPGDELPMKVFSCAPEMRTLPHESHPVLAKPTSGADWHLENFCLPRELKPTLSGPK
mmetsp:Transcript_31981/g.84572  ORF Transcript_31981/g.84572 Transcript_31981/m.84572 type:complete len:218 (-) Transcript_31981:267-920(-)